MSHKLTIELSAPEHKRIKTFENLMQRKFNKVTEKALKMSEQRKGLKKFDSLNELFEDLGI